MEHSPNIQNLATALAKAQAGMPSAKMDKVNPFLKNRYADLGSVIEASRESLAKQGLSVSQFPVSNNGSLGIETVLMHASGEWISEKIYLPVADEKGKSGAQIAGSIITYLRRYALAAVLGIYADEDDDGAPQAKRTRSPQPATAKSAMPSETELADKIIETAHAPAPATTLGLPPDEKFAKKNGRVGAGEQKGKFTIAPGSTTYPALGKWAIAQGYYQAGDTSATYRLQNILLGEGVNQYKDEDIEKYKEIVSAHYAKQKEEELPF